LKIAVKMSRKWPAQETTHPAFPSRLALAVLLPVLMTGSVAAADLLITNGTSTKSH
jgi:hypothetical protein